ncbi:pyridoxal phosphate enzyme, YggS family [Leptospira ryugenii]|uniref:Pyridoxal phosphate enzyme, YggS family n=1 Tax=Leptospira ryugenii TaxID=1917863 RepID=A0A2P2DY84_9LEPT|nr:YggS family pyridoxal phosphate-dependent enzyme [Leptospira ryugenii]GBF49582.1 pyridoxal phosphate enzyme, YggS family [Leptospira ryugenii]
MKAKFPLRDFAIIAVSKTKEYPIVREAYLQGIRIFGENYIPEATEKFQRLFSEFPNAKDEVQLHHIGPTQTGTLRKLFPLFTATHGVASFSTLKELLKRAEKEQTSISYFLQCNISGEETKHGFSFEEILMAKEQSVPFENPCCKFLGFMGMGPSSGDETETRAAFLRLAQFRDQSFPDKKLSMGMSGDFEWAVELGSNYLRIGSLIFGERTYG